MHIKNTYLGLSDLSQAMGFIEEQLDTTKTDKKDKLKVMLLAEEAYVELCNNITEGEKISIYAVKRMGKMKFSLQAKGTEMSQNIGSFTDFNGDDIDAGESAEAAIRKMILNANQGILNISYKNCINNVSIKTPKSSSSLMLYMLISLILAIVFGIILRTMPTDIASVINMSFLVPIKTIILNVLMMVVGPMVFFSIASAVGQFSDFRLLGKTGARVILFYLFTTIIAIIVSLSSFYILQPGKWGVFLGEANSGEVAEASGIDFIDTIVSAVPDNFITAFADSNTLQIIVLAVLFGIAAAMLGKTSEAVATFFNCATELILKLVEIITKVVPLLIFVAFSSLIYSTEIESLLSLLSVFGTLVAADLAMIVAYNIMVLIFARKNPVKFTRAVFPAWLNAFALQSSNAAMPVTLETCKNRLHISPMICSFSIPLGATINMDGATICYCMGGLFFAKGYGINMDLPMLITLVITCVILSVSSPGLPGAGIMAYSIILATLGVPAEALTLFIAIGTFIDPIDTADNVLGDMVGTYIVAHRTGMVSEDL